MKMKFAMHFMSNVWENWPDFQVPMNPGSGKDVSNFLKLGTVFLCNVVVCMHYWQLFDSSIGHQSRKGKILGF
jgi:hypothetical protein